MTEASNLNPTSGNRDPGTQYDNSAAAHPGTNTQLPNRRGLGLAVDTEELFRERMRNGDLPAFVVDNVRYFETQDRKRRAMARERHEEIEMLTRRINDNGLRITGAKWSARDQGPYRKEIHEASAEGSKVTVEETGYIEKMEADLAEDNARLKLLRAGQPDQNWFTPIRNFAGLHHLPTLIPDTFPDYLDLTPREAEANYESEYIGLTELKAELDATWRAPRTQEEAMNAFDSWLENAAREGAPGVGGFYRGYTEHQGGRNRVETAPALGWVKLILRYDPFVEMIDVENTLAFLLKDQIREAVAPIIKAGADPSKAISAIDKPGIVKQVESRIYKQRKVLEIAIRQLEKSGRRYVKRPTDTPISILLQFVPGGVAVDPEFG